MGRRTSEKLYDLLSRRSSDAEGRDTDTAGGSASRPSLPVTEPERAAAAAWLMELLSRSPQDAREVREWVREASWLTPRMAAVRPRMLPPTTAMFTDRADVLTWLTALMDDDRATGAPAVAVVTGQGGIGKTAVVIQCALALEERFPDGVLFADLQGASASTALAPSDVLARFLERLGVPPAMVPGDEARQRDLYRDCTADRRMIVVLDNAHSAAQAAPLLPASSHALVLVTSRHRLEGLVGDHGARPYLLGPLSTEDSVTLIRRVVGNDRAPAPDAVVRAVADGTGGVPLAVCTTGASLAVREHLTWERVARQLADRIRGHDQEGSTVVSESGPDVPADPVRLAQDTAYRELTPDCAALYRAIAVWAWPTVTVLCAAHTAEIGMDEARVRLEQLARVHLLEEVGEERYRFHDLTRAHAHERAVAEDGHGRMAAAIRRVAIAHLRFAAGADFRVMPLRWRLGPAYQHLALPERRARDDGKHALAELLRERENLAAVIRAAAHHGFDDLVWQLCEAMWGLHLRLGFHTQWIDTHLLGIEAARRSAEEFGDRRAAGRMWTQLAFAYMGAGQAREAADALDHARSAERACGHHRGEASAVEARGLLHLKQWEFEAAQRCFEEARAILRRIGPGEDGFGDVPRATALLDHHIGRVLTRRRDLGTAVIQLNDALAQFRRLPGDDGGDLYNAGRVYMSLGDAHLAGGDAELARVCLDEAVTAMTEAGAGLQLAEALEARADCHRLAGRPAQEREDLHAAAACYEQNGDQAGLERIRARLAGAHP
ncbi:NB-ARC domain-containing protein [Streptomyces sp. NPDC048278]|uniref:NB-ARC domain-containing protein n=1 Tax=Streptomyces sp. NPDC048278 TaxID=3155809 RepID=UPI00341B1C5E